MTGFLDLGSDISSTPDVMVILIEKAKHCISDFLNLYHLEP
jgi:hypothetical protein